MVNCNLIIPTYNRPEYLRQILDYYLKHGSDFNIIVADSSSDEKKQINKKIILSFPTLKIRHISHYSSKINPHHKFADAVNRADKKYCLFCADDDFIAPEGIKQSVDFLEENPDFTAAHGQYIYFFLTKDKGKTEFWWRPLYQHNKSVVAATPEKRLFLHFSDYCQTLYAVHRTDSFRMIYKELLSSKVDPLLFGELLPDMLCAIYGKIKRLDDFYAARDAHSRCSSWPGIADFILKDRYEAEYSKFRNSLSLHLSKNSGFSAEVSERAVDKAVSAYMWKYHPKSLVMLKAGKKKTILDYLPLRIYKKIRLLHKKLFFSGENDDFSVSLQSISSRYYDDFNKIRDHVISYAEKRI